MKLLEYSYTHVLTEGTTGYFACRAAFDMPWQKALLMLSERPHDSWLRDHVIVQLGALPENTRNDLRSFCLNAAAPCVFPELVQLERGLLHEILLDANLVKGANADADNTATTKLCEIANNNIHKHIAVPKAIFTEDITASERMETMAPHLSGASESGMHVWKNQLVKEELKNVATRALLALERAHVLDGPEMRHEASLSPIALLRRWRLESAVHYGSSPCRLTGLATAYGRGLSLVQARVSCLMEIVERLSAHAVIDENGEFRRQPQLGQMLYGKKRELLMRGIPLADLRIDKVSADEPLFWLPAQNCFGTVCYVPASDVFLFLNLPEKRAYPARGSTGLAAGSTMAGARLNALVEVLERHAHATMPHNPAKCFIPSSQDKLLQSLLDDYRARGINVYLEDITAENGLPVYRCFVIGRDGQIVQSTGAGLNGREAVLSALGETPWPYAYSRVDLFARPSARLSPAPPIRFLESLPDYSTDNPAEDLAKLENLFSGWQRPLYVDLSRTDMQFPVMRCLIPAYEIDADFNEKNIPGSGLIGRMRAL